MDVEVRRWKATRSRFATGPGAAWNWRYDATLPDGRKLEGIERLSIIERMVRQAGGKPRRAWEQ